MGEGAAGGGDTEDVFAGADAGGGRPGQAATALAHQISRRYTASGQPQRIATLDGDATIVESQKRAAKWTYEGTRGYQPLVVVWAELNYVPGAAYEQKQSRPLRYIGLRLAKPQRELFADGTAHHYHTVISNRSERGDWLLAWHREKAGSVEHTHEEVKNGLGGGRLPSRKFGANAAWFRLALMVYNVVSAMRGLALGDSLRTAKLKRLRLWVFALCGRMIAAEARCDCG